MKGYEKHCSILQYHTNALSSRIQKYSKCIKNRFRMFQETTMKLHEKSWKYMKVHYEKKTKIHENTPLHHASLCYCDLLCLSWHGPPNAPHNSMQFLPGSAVCSSSPPPSKRNRFRAGDEIGVACGSALEAAKIWLAIQLFHQAVNIWEWHWMLMALSLLEEMFSIVFICFHIFHVFSNVFSLTLNKINKTS